MRKLFKTALELHRFFIYLLQEQILKVPKFPFYGYFETGLYAN